MVEELETEIGGILIRGPVKVETRSFRPLLKSALFSHETI